MDEEGDDRKIREVDDRCSRSGTSRTDSRGRYLADSVARSAASAKSPGYSDRPRGSEPPRERRGKHHAYKRRAHPETRKEWKGVNNRKTGTLKT
ncbi:hypothetical protein TNCV_4927871 [Trichonephila clavipes]|nr:hypothetical protein TNCV_4927871 [Trichonephila clavipes]